MFSEYTLRLATILTAAGFSAACASGAAAPNPSTASVTRGCDIGAAASWIERWTAAWDLTSRHILRLRNASTPNIVFFDNSCVFTTSQVSAGAAANRKGTKVSGYALPWWAAKHDGTLTAPNGRKLRVRLISMADYDRRTGPFLIMAAPNFWKEAGHGAEPPTPVFIHELTHTQQSAGMASILAAIDSAWTFPEPLADDMLQQRFGSDSTYHAAYIAERDLLYRAAEASSISEVRALAAEAATMMRARHARWFTGENAVFAMIDAAALSMEGAAQWAAYAWLSHAAGGGLDKPAAIKRMLGRRRFWDQDEGLGLFLVVDRLLPEWPSLVFRTPSIDAIELLGHAIKKGRQ